MKEKLMKMLRSGISLLLVCCMVAGFIPSVAFAEEEPEKTINYVSLGDSMTNGYGLSGYNGNSGVLDYGYGSYTNQFALWLEENDYADKVNHFQLALSAMRAEDLHWLLEVDYTDETVLSLIQEMDYNYRNNKLGTINAAIADGRLDEDYANALSAESSKKTYFEAYADKWNSMFSNGDSWTWRELVHDYRFTVIANYINYYAAGNTNTNIDLETEWSGYNNDMSDVEALEIVAEYFQDAVADADIVSNGIGNGNFGVFILGRIEEAIGFGGKPVETLTYKVENAIRECDPAVQTKILALKDTLYAELNKYVAVEGNDLMEALVNSMVYGGLSYVLNWCGSVDAIVELNPDAEIVIMGLMNTMNGIKMEVGGTTIDIGKCMGIMLDTLNAYMAGYPVVMQALGHYEDAKFYYAEERQVQCYADTYNDTIYDPDAIVRDRFVKSIVGEDGDELIWNSIRPIAKSMGTELQTITLAQIQAYEALTDTEKIGYAQTNGKTAMSIALYLAAEKAVLQVLRDGGTMSADAAVKMGDGSLSTDGVVALFEEKLAEYTPAATKQVIDAIGAEAFAGVSESQQGMLVALFAMPDALGEALAEDKDVGGLLNLYAHCLLGNGLSGHPSQGGHDQLADAIIDAYSTGHTALDQTMDNVEDLMAELYNLAVTYGPEVAAQVWDQWVEYGYVDAVEDAIDELEATLEEKYEYYSTTVLPAMEAALKSLAAQKDDLAKQLAALEAQLAAKKAELEALIEAGVTETTEAYLAAKAELENAIAQIEQAVADVQALINGVADEIVSVSDAVDAILKAVDQLGKTLADLGDAALDVKTTIADVLDTLASADADALIDTFLDTFDAARKAAVEAAELLETVMGEAGELVEDIDAAIEALVEDITDLYDMVVAGINGCIAALPEDVQKLLAAAADAIEENLKNAKAEVEAALAEKIAEAQAEFEAKLAEAEAELKAELAEKQAELEALAEQIKAEAEEKCAEIKAQIDAKVAELEAKQAELEAQLADYQKQLEEAAEELQVELEAKIAEVEAEIEDIKGQIEDALDDLEDAYNAAVAEVEEKYAEAVAALEQAAADLKAQLDEVAAEIEKELNAAVETLKEEAQKQLDALAATAEEALKALEEISANVSEDLAAAVEELAGQLADAKTAVDELLSGSKEALDKLVDTAENLYATGVEKIEELVDEVIDTIETMLYQATHGDLTIDDDFKYVALGDGSAVAEGYVEILEKYLNEEATNNGVKGGITCTNYAFAKNTPTKELKNTKELAGKVAGADLVTLGFSDVTFLANVYDTEVDWAEYVGEDYAPYIEELVEQIKAELLESGLTETDATNYSGLINTLAFSIVQYGVEMPMLAAAIHEINPEALVVIVGMYNPLSGVSFETGDGVVEFGDYVDYLVDAAAVHGMAYALISGNAIYVDAQNVQTNNTSTVLGNSELLQLFGTGFKALYPSAAGHQYIANQIADALNLSYEPTGLWGDANMDGVVNARDVMRLIQYLAGEKDAKDLNLSVCDVNGDGSVNARDTMLIKQYIVGRFEKFPVEE